MTGALLLAAAAWACPVCGAADSSRDQSMYVVMTAVLSLLPLAMGGGIIYWVVRSAMAPSPSGDAE